MSRSTDQQIELAERVFARLSVMYGTKLLDMWRGIDRAEVIKCWGEELEHFEVAAIKSAIDALKWNNTFPPTLPEFLKLCSEAQDRIAKERKVYLPSTAIPAPVDQTDPIVADARARCFATWRKLNPHAANRINGLDKVMEEIGERK